LAAGSKSTLLTVDRELHAEEGIEEAPLLELLQELRRDIEPMVLAKPEEGVGLKRWADAEGLVLEKHSK
jgi:hypothetical protein